LSRYLSRSRSNGLTFRCYLKFTANSISLLNSKSQIKNIWLYFELWKLFISLFWLITFWKQIWIALIATTISQSIREQQQINNKAKQQLQRGVNFTNSLWAAFLLINLPWSQFHQHFTPAFFIRKSFEQLFSAQSSALKKLSYEKRMHKMLMKLTPALTGVWRNV